MNHFKIALDGPSGAGKSTLAKAIAAKMEIIYVDTGALYRSIGLAAILRGIDKSDSAAVIAMLPEISLKMIHEDGVQKILLDGENVGDRIRTPEASMYASAVSAIPEVRAFLLDTQRSIAEKNSVIMDGRDIGTVIFPDAEVKIFLTASIEARAKRRFVELTEKGIETTYESVLNDMQTRDKNDSSRAVAPAVPAKDAVILDNSDYTLEETTTAALDIIENALSKNANKSTAEKKKKRHPQKGTRIYRFFYFLLAGIVRLFYRIRVTGLENIPENGGAVLAANHIAIRDVFIIAASIDRQPRFLAKAELFKVPVISSLIRMLGATPLERTGHDVGAVKSIISIAASGNVTTVFPQGTRRPGVNPADTPIKNGIAMIAHRANVPMVPICIKTKDCSYKLFRPVELIIGKPITPTEAGLVNGGTEEYRVAANKVFGEICRLGGYEPTKKAEETEIEK